MAAVQLSQFLRKAAKAAAEYIQILDGDTQQPDARNAIIEVAAIQALSQIQGYTKRKWILDSYCENHVLENAESIIKIKEAPFAATSNLVVILKQSPGNDQTLVEDEDYVVERNNIRFFTDTTFDNFTTGDDLIDFRERVFEVTYDGGLSSVGDDDTLQSAVALQTSANYKRAPVTGLQTITGGSQTGGLTQASQAGNTGGIIQSVKDILDSLVYEGRAFDC